jgi:hypothetical protein
MTQNVMRDPADVIDAVIAILPPDTDPLKEDLEHIRDNSLYQPPEAKYLTWARLASILTKALPQPGTDA